MTPRNARCNNRDGLYNFKEAVLIMEVLVFAVRQALDFHTLDAPNVYFRRLYHIDLNISVVKDRFNNKIVKYNNNTIKQNILLNISETRIFVTTL